jgi:hypothetical protein
MNFIGHHEVARRLVGDEDDRAYMFGSMTPDFIGMFRVHRTSGQMIDERLKAGIKLHQMTDSVFDEQAPIKQLETEMIASFKSFMPRWPAVQSARVGKDILFDGIFLKMTKP